jgi:transposase
MPNQSYPTDLIDRQWAHIKHCVPPAKPGGRPCSLAMRFVVNVSLYSVVTGAPWRMLPRAYPTWPSVSAYFAQWRDQGVWHRMHDPSASARPTPRRASQARHSGLFG